MQHIVHLSSSTDIFFFVVAALNLDCIVTLLDPAVQEVKTTALYLLSEACSCPLRPHFSYLLTRLLICTFIFESKGVIFANSKDVQL